jgi:hypothetical protein
MAVVVVFAPLVYVFVAANRHGGIGPGQTFELLALCWPIEIAGAVVASGSVKRLKQGRERHASSRAALRGCLVGSRLAFWAALVVAVVTPVALFFLLALSIGVAG